MMRFLLISILLLSLFSCKLNTVATYKKVDSISETFQNIYFSDISKDYIYKTSIDVYGNHFGGITIIKKIGDLHHRLVFTTEFGNKIFDFEFINDNFKINFIVDELNKKVLINTLKKDFKLLLREENNVLSKYQNDHFTVYQTQADNRYNFYFVNKERRVLERLINTSKSKEKLHINFESNRGTIANRIEMEHKNIKLKIELKYMQSDI